MPRNRAHVEVHVPTWFAESVFNAPDFNASIVQDDELVAHGYGTIGEKSYFLVFSKTRYETPESIYIITCYHKERE
jgi:hypothetical protein